MTDYKIMLDEVDFRCIVRGGVLKIKARDNTTIEIALSDIGFDRMRESIDDAEDGTEATYEGRERDIAR